VQLPESGQNVVRPLRWERSHSGRWSGTGGKERPWVRSPAATTTLTTALPAILAVALTATALATVVIVITGTTVVPGAAAADVVDVPGSTRALHVTGSHPAVLPHVLVHLARSHAVAQATFHVVHEILDGTPVLVPSLHHEPELLHLLCVVSLTQGLADDSGGAFGGQTFFVQPCGGLRRRRQILETAATVAQTQACLFAQVIEFFLGHSAPQLLGHFTGHAAFLPWVFRRCDTVQPGLGHDPVGGPQVLFHPHAGLLHCLFRHTLGVPFLDLSQQGFERYARLGRSQEAVLESELSLSRVSARFVHGGKERTEVLRGHAQAQTCFQVGVHGLALVRAELRIAVDTVAKLLLPLPALVRWLASPAEARPRNRQSA